MMELQSRLDPERAADIRHLLVTLNPERSGKVSRQRRLVVAALAAVVAAVLVVYPHGQPPPDYAAWTAVPQAAPPLTAPRDDIERWASKCSDLGVGGVGVGGVPAGKKAAAERQVLVDRRGGFVYCVDVSLGRGTPTDPLIGLSGLKTRDGNTMAATVYDKPFTPPQEGSVLLLGGVFDDAEAFQMYGLSGPDVQGVDVVLANGLRMATTLRNGIWGVWWPSDRGDPTGCRLQVRTAGGVTTVDPQKVRLFY